MSEHPKFIVCVFDGLRRDMITAEAMPNLRRFMDQGVDFPMSRSVFPTATRVNSAALGHGATPDQTGLIANKYFDAGIFQDRLFDTSTIADFNSASAAHDGRFIEAVSLGEAAQAAGFKTAVIGSGSAGATRWVNPMAEPLGHVGLCLRDWSSSVPQDYAENILARFGPIPPAATPNIERQIMQTDILVDAVLPEIEPDIAFMWFTDPDATYHLYGIGSPESWAALANTDAQFGRILDWRDGAAEGDRVQIFTLSDHSHLSATHKIDLKGEMVSAGLAIGNSFVDDVDFVVAEGYAGVVSVRDSDPGLIKRLVSWLEAQPWCGLIFTAGAVPGTLDRSLLMIDHPRAPDVYFMMRTFDDANSHGFPGGTYFDAKYNEGGAVHGGLHEMEINNVMAAGGSAFRSSTRTELPAGIIDIAPTILHLLGCERPDSMTGRVLIEGLAGAAQAPDRFETKLYSAGQSPRRHMLRRWRVGDTYYIDQGWLE